MCVSPVGGDAHSDNAPMVFSGDPLSRKRDIYHIRGGELHVSDGQWLVGTWNVEGLTDKKLEELQLWMYELGIGVLCMQETHKSGSEYSITEAGFLLILSGGNGVRETAGVGFLIAPVLRRSVIGFCQATARMASLKLRVAGGKVGIVTAYAPHSKVAPDHRQAFYQDLSHFVGNLSVHGPKLVLGDMNARLQCRFPGEEDIMGPYIFESPATILNAESNRNHLVELCTTHDLMIANTLFNERPENMITCYNVGAKPMDPPTSNNFGQIDFVLVPRRSVDCVQRIYSDRTRALASHHFLVVAEVRLGVPKMPRVAERRRLDEAALRQADVAKHFAQAFDEHMAASETSAQTHIYPQDVNQFCARMAEAFEGAATDVLPSRAVVARRPWISDATLSLIEARNEARRLGASEREILLNKRIKAAVKTDKNSWLDSMVASGDWTQIRRLRQNGGTSRQGRLRNSQGELVDSDARAETMAEYLEQVQWAVRPTAPSLRTESLGSELPVNLGPIDAEEVVRAAKKLKYKKASGADDVPPEYWKAIVLHGTTARRWAIEFCQACWSQKRIPEEWHNAQVASIFKKGDAALCSNYRPISLLTIGYKLFAAILLERLKLAGAERRIWPTQFGFRSGYGTSDALFLARRLLDEAWAMKEGSLIMLALDWAKAFDSISPDALLRALRRFGIPSPYVDMVQAIYTDRTFVVKDAGRVSDQHPQHFGISQGCPLSPFLFVIVMTVLMTDAKVKLREELGVELATDLIANELLYADDTLIVDVSNEAVTQYMECIASAGAEYGLSFNWSKLEALPVRCDAAISTPAGNVKVKDSIVYLGGLLSNDGCVGSELGRRIGLAQVEFKTLRRIWSHASISQSKKLRIFHACVISKLMYSLHTTWLNTSERRRLDGFYVRCLRRIVGIPSAYISRINNRTVLERAGSQMLSSTLLAHQLKFFAHVARQPSGSALRDSIFEPHTFNPRCLPGARCRGRPRITWAQAVFAEAALVAGSSQQLTTLLQNTSGADSAWRAKLHDYCNQLSA